MNTRSRFGNVVNVRDVPWQRFSGATARCDGATQEVAAAVGARDLGYHFEVVDPGCVSAPFHFHHHEEEMIYVLEGRATLRQGDEAGEETIEVGPGDVIGFPPGTGVAHHFHNHTDRPFHFLAVSNHVRADVVEYPDSDKLMIRATRMIVRRRPRLDYWDGEG